MRGKPQAKVRLYELRKQVWVHSIVPNARTLERPAQPPASPAGGSPRLPDGLETQMALFANRRVGVLAGIRGVHSIFHFVRLTNGGLSGM